MKKLILSATIGAVLLIGPAITSPAQAADASVNFSWTYPAEELKFVDAFKLYTATNLVFNLNTNTVPPTSVWTRTNFTVLATIPGSNLTYTTTMTMREQYFFLVSSNLWGESEPSPIASTPPVPKVVPKATIKKSL